MIVKYNNKEIETYNCVSFYSRLMGFMGKNEIKKCLCFYHCNSIHTFFMKKNIDVLFCNKDNIIIKYYSNLKKNKVILPVKDADYVLELPVNYFDDIEIGKRVEIIDEN